MREIAARAVCVLTIIVVLVLAHVFAARHNPRMAAPASPAEPVGQDRVLPSVPNTVRGRAVYAEQGCASCHAIAGAGNPRNPLDGVGARRDRSELFEWATGTGAAADQLSPATVRRKERYRALSSNDLDALVAYLTSLPATP